MINAERIMPVTKTDLISLYSVILAQNSEYSAYLLHLAADSVDGCFKCDSAGLFIADQPLKSCDFGTFEDPVRVFFVADDHFSGFSIDGVKVTPSASSVEVIADGSLYSVTVANNTLTVAKVGF